MATACCLLHRGNRGDSPNAVIELDYGALATGLTQGRVPRGMRPRRVTEGGTRKHGRHAAGFHRCPQPGAGNCGCTARWPKTPHDARGWRQVSARVIGLCHARWPASLGSGASRRRSRSRGSTPPARRCARPSSASTDADDPAVPAQLLRDQRASATRNRAVNGALSCGYSPRSFDAAARSWRGRFSGRPPRSLGCGAGVTVMYMMAGDRAVVGHAGAYHRALVDIGHPDIVSVAARAGRRGWRCSG